MTHAETIQKAYRWAFEVRSNKKSNILDLWCSRHVLDIVEGQNQPEIAYEMLLGLIREWKRDRRPGLESPVGVLTRILGAPEEAIQS